MFVKLFQRVLSKFTLFFLPLIIIISCQKSNNENILFQELSDNLKEKNLVFIISENDCQTCLNHIKFWVKDAKSKNLDINILGLYYQKGKLDNFGLFSSLEKLSSEGYSISWKKVNNKEVISYLTNKCNCISPLAIKIVNRKIVYIKNITESSFK